MGQCESVGEGAVSNGGERSMRAQGGGRAGPTPTRRCEGTAEAPDPVAALILSQRMPQGRDSCNLRNEFEEGKKTSGKGNLEMNHTTLRQGCMPTH